MSNTPDPASDWAPVEPHNHYKLLATLSISEIAYFITKMQQNFIYNVYPCIV